MNIYKKVEQYIEEYPPLEDPVVTSVLLTKNNIFEVNIKCTASYGDYGRRKTIYLDYDIIDNEIKLWEKK